MILFAAGFVAGAAVAVLFLGWAFCGAPEGR